MFLQKSWQNRVSQIFAMNGHSEFVCLNYLQGTTLSTEKILLIYFKKYNLMYLIETHYKAFLLKLER